MELWITERYCPGLTEADAMSAVSALRAACRATAVDGDVHFVDGVWLPEDETLAARFVGRRTAVERVHEIAHTPYDRVTRAIDLE